MCREHEQNLRFRILIFTFRSEKMKYLCYWAGIGCKGKSLSSRMWRTGPSLARLHMRIYIRYGTCTTRLINWAYTYSKSNEPIDSLGLPLATSLWLQVTFALTANEWKIDWWKSTVWRSTQASSMFSTQATGQGALPLRVQLCYV